MSKLFHRLAAAATLVAAAAGLVPAQTPRVSAEAALGRKIFNDPSLSASGKMSCATCHDPAHAYGPPNGLAVQEGGTRAVPSLRYTLNRTPFWHHTYTENKAERLTEGEEPPTGGFGWDGRFNTLHDQAAFPLLAPNEMANANPQEVAAKLRRASYADEFREVFGDRETFAKALIAIERFELEAPDLHPYTSKFDDYLDGKVKLTEQEERGRKLFDDPRRGNCASCHIDRLGANGSHPLFTDYQFEALGVPRNPEIPANARPDYYDMGLCGPVRQDQSGKSNYCGMFKTPTLRNVATRSVFFHNGRFHTLKDALRFYVRRDTDPKLWYPGDKFDDLPPHLRANVDTIDEPLTRREGDPPAWTDAEIDDVIAFLKTLTDRDVPEHVAADPRNVR